MIVVPRLNGGMFGVNPDLIQRVDSTPDTILTLIDGTKLILAESMDEVIARINEYRARILARARELQSMAGEATGGIRPVPGPQDDPDDFDPDEPPTAPPSPLRSVR